MNILVKVTSQKLFMGIKRIVVKHENQQNSLKDKVLNLILLFLRHVGKEARREGGYNV